MLSYCETRIPFIHLLERFSQVGIKHQGVQEEHNGLFCKVVSIPPPPGTDSNNDIYTLVTDALLQCTFRIQGKTNKLWTVELVFKSPPLSCAKPRHNQDCVRLNLTYECRVSQLPDKPDVVKQFLHEWAAINMMYEPVFVFSQQLRHPACNIKDFAQVYSYNYKTITIKYGPGLKFFVTIGRITDQRYLLQLGCVGADLDVVGGELTATSAEVNSNPHLLTSHHLTEMFNQKRDIATLVHILNSTYHPLRSLSMLPSIAVLGAGHKVGMADQIFNVSAQTANTIHVTFCSVFCIEVHCRWDGTVAVKDASFSMFDNSKVKNKLVPIQGFATFLSQFRDLRDNRTRVEAERDNPPSPQPQQQRSTEYGLKEISSGLWSGSYHTLISHQTLAKLCTSQLPNRGALTFSPSPLEQFLGAAIVKRHIEKSIKEETAKNNKTLVLMQPPTESGMVTVFQSNSLTFQCAMQTNPQHPLYMRQVFMTAMPHQQREMWNQDDLRFLEKYFEYRIALSPYRYLNLY